MRAASLILLVLGALCVAALSRAPEEPPRTPDDVPILPRPAAIKVVFPGERLLAADYFWLIAINRIGAARTPHEFRDSYYYADLLTDIDPDFYYPYLFTAAALPVRVGRVEYENTDLSTALLKKGLARFPRDTRLRYQLALNLIFYHHDYVAGANLLTELSREPGAPKLWAALATRLYAQAGAFETSEELARSLADNSTDPDERAFYAQRVLEIDQEKVLRLVDEAAARFKAARGRMPASVDELVATGELRARPEDPMGGQISFDEDGRARSSATNQRLELIEDKEDTFEQPAGH
ncbi:MAG: pilus assembly protein PilG [Myxococcaceae bacterium]